MLKLTENPWYLCGFERECLRVTEQATLADTLHPDKLGSKLTNRHITTDFAEAQLELITDTFHSTKDALLQLAKVQDYILCCLHNEYLWPASMPCVLPADDKIPIAYFGTSHLGRIKTLYRKGLSYRYGRSMQTICGLHFNFSVSTDFWQKLSVMSGQKNNQEWINKKYFDVIRNYRRRAFAVQWLFGASPVFDNSFMKNSRLAQKSDYQRVRDTWLAPHGSSLRMTDIGYMAPEQEVVQMCFDGLDDYLKSIRKALQIPIDRFSAIGLRGIHGEHLQLSDKLLQIENEYYSQIRPKRNSRKHSKPVHALEHEGVEYIEIRNIDVDPFSTHGISQTTADFMVLLLLNCLLVESSSMSTEECQRVNANAITASKQGHDSQANVHYLDKIMPVKMAVDHIIQELIPIAEMLAQNGQQHYLEAVQQVHYQVQSNNLPSQKVLRNSYDSDFCSWALTLAKQYTKSARKAVESDYFLAIAKQSHSEQQQLEKQDKTNGISFDDYVENYLAV